MCVGDETKWLRLEGITAFDRLSLTSGIDCCLDVADLALQMRKYFVRYEYS